MAVDTRGHQRDQDVGLQVESVDEYQRALWNAAPQRRSKRSLTVGVGPKYRCGQQVRPHRHEDDSTHERVAADTATGARTGAAEVRAILGANSYAQRRAVHRVEPEPAPAIPIGAGVRPGLARSQEQPFHRIRTEPGACLRQRTRRDGP